MEFSVMVYRHKYTLCEIFSGITKTGHWVSCIRILDYRGSKLEAQMTLGHVYSVHHNTFTYITEIKRALHNRVLLPHFFFFPRLLRRLWAQAKPSTKCASAKDIWAIESHNSLKSIQSFRNSATQCIHSAKWNKLLYVLSASNPAKRYIV